MTSGGPHAAPATPLFPEAREPREHALSPAPQRHRRTVHFDDERFGQALASTLARLAAAPLPGLARAADGSVDDAALALLKAYLDAARPAGGLDLGWANTAAGRAWLARAGQANAAAGDSRPRLLARIRAGQAVDLRLAVAMLAWFRRVSDQPALSLQDIGGVEVERLRALEPVEDAIRQARHALPQAVIDGLLRRTRETADYLWLLQDVHYRYSDFAVQAAADGGQRLHVTRHMVYRPLRLAEFPGPLQPSQSLEWHEWHRLRRARLTVRRFDADGRLQDQRSAELPKRADAQNGVVRVALTAEQQRAWADLLTVPAAGRQQGWHEVEWALDLALGLADRDILVSYVPAHPVHVHVDAEALAAYTVQVGDAPGLVRTGSGWRLDRTLMPREVLAVRMRWQGLAVEDPAAYDPCTPAPAPAPPRPRRRAP